MRIISQHMMQWHEQSPLFLASSYELGFVSWIQRPFFQETLNFGVRTACARVTQGQRTVIQLDDANANCFIYVNNIGIAGMVVTDMQYPQKVCFQIIAQMFSEFRKVFDVSGIDKIIKDENIKFARMDQMTQNYQDPQEADQILKLQETLNEVTEICHKNMDELLKRGQKLDDLMQKSKDMSGVSVEFYKNAQKANKQCCSLI